MKIYTKTGDLGETSLYGGTRVSKDHIRIESYGTIDELNSWLGLLRDELTNVEVTNALFEIQKTLFHIGAELALDPEKEFLANGTPRLKKTIQADDVLFLENLIDEYEQNLPQLSHFILPGGNTIVSHIHIARTVCRRGERIVVALANLEKVNISIIQYLNRLSDWLFTLARKTSNENGSLETLWLP